MDSGTLKHCSGTLNVDKWYLGSKLLTAIKDSVWTQILVTGYVCLKKFA